VSFTVPHPHPIIRASASIRGHRLHIGRPVDQFGYVASCSCSRWARFRLARRDAVRAFHIHLDHINDRKAA
jgi:hypothetical protein